MAFGILFSLCTLSRVFESFSVPLAQGVPFPGIPINSNPGSENFAFSLGPFGFSLGETNRETYEEEIGFHHDDNPSPMVMHFGGESESTSTLGRADKPIFFASQPAPPRLAPNPEPKPVVNKTEEIDILVSTPPVAVIHFKDIHIPVDYENCSYANGATLYKDECVRLLSSEPCAPGYWLVLTQQKSPVPYCARKQCREGLIHYKKKCIEPFDQEACNEGELLYVDYFGNTHCDCVTSFLYDDVQGKCLPEHSRGSCNYSYHLELDESGDVNCVYNPCGREGFVPYKDSGICYAKNFTGSCRQRNQQLTYNHRKRVVNCYFTSTRNIFEVRAVNSCSPGTKQNYSGACQAILRIDPRSGPHSYRVPTRHSTYATNCDPGYHRRNIDNSCHKDNPLFG